LLGGRFAAVDSFPIRFDATRCVCSTFRGGRTADLTDEPSLDQPGSPPPATAVPRYDQRFTRRESNRYLIGWLILDFLKSGCLGFNKKFTSLALRTLGTARATNFPARTHSSPICIVWESGGSAFQCNGRFLAGKREVRLSSHSSRNDRYRSSGGSGVRWTSNSSAASDSCSLT